MNVKISILIAITTLSLLLSGCGNRADEPKSGPCALSYDAPDCDQDRDGLTNKEEANIGTDPKNPDTDGDAFRDGEDSENDPLDPCKPSINSNTCDRDGDRLLNGEERKIGTDPTNKDTDADGIDDGDEVDNGTNPTDACDPNKEVAACDQDNDGRTNQEEDEFDNTDKTNPDTDGDTIKDGVEFKEGTDPRDACKPNNNAGQCDQDGDGLLNEKEDQLKTDKTNPDTDGDGINDGVEVNDDSTDAKNPCDPQQDKSYSNYDNNNDIWQKGDCDNDTYLNGSEDNVSLANKHLLSNPYDANSSCFQFNELKYCELKLGTSIWLDRNMGSPNTCEADSLNNEECFGEYYQWGRLTEGHQAKDSLTTNKGSANIEGKFVKIAALDNEDWINDDINGESRSNLWKDNNQGLLCPNDWAVPTKENFEAVKDISERLLIPETGVRDAQTANYLINGDAVLWTASTPNSSTEKANAYDANNKVIGSTSRAKGLPVRCIKK